MKVGEIISAIEEFAPLSIQEKWDNSGLIIGSPNQEVHKLLIGFDCTAELVDEAVASGADMILTHHPLIFGGLKKISPEDPVGLTVMKAVSAGIAVYAAHTTADKVLAGVSGAMASRLGLVNVSILESEGDGSTGLGAVGDLPKPLSAEEAVALVKEKFSLKAARCSRLVNVPVTRIAMCGGSGSSLISEAMGEEVHLSAGGSVRRWQAAPSFISAEISRTTIFSCLTGLW